jgi:hypothetical protein
VSREKLEADWLRFLETMQPAFDALVNVLPVLAKANAPRRVEDTEQRQRHLSMQLSEKKTLRNSLVESKLRSELKQEEFRERADVVREVSAVPAKTFWASAHLTDKYRTDNRFFEPPDNELQAMYSGYFLQTSENQIGKKIESGRDDWI